MNTPWGKSDSKINIERGISWVGTPSHGGLAITITKALETLSWPAIKIANGSNGILLYKGKSGYLFFEEDCAYAVAFYEHPEWQKALEEKEMEDLRNSGLTHVPPYDHMYDKLEKSIARTDEQIKAEMAEVIRRYYPEYFAS